MCIYRAVAMGRVRSRSEMGLECGTKSDKARIKVRVRVRVRARVTARERPAGALDS